MASVTHVSYRMWLVETEEGDFYVLYERGKWKCISCADFRRRGSCPHIRMVWDWLKEHPLKGEIKVG